MVKPVVLLIVKAPEPEILKVPLSPTPLPRFSVLAAAPAVVIWAVPPLLICALIFVSGAPFGVQLVPVNHVFVPAFQMD
jgi:hypothetical protein